MADETLTKAGLHFDDLNKLRVLEPEVSSQSSDLNDECKDFLSKMMQFQSITSNFSKSLGSVALAVNKSKLEAIGSRNQLRSMAKERESQQQQLKTLIFEKKMELERLKVHYESLVKMEQQQNELIEQFALSN